MCSLGCRNSPCTHCAGLNTIPCVVSSSGSMGLENSEASEIFSFEVPVKGSHVYLAQFHCFLCGCK